MRRRDLVQEEGALPKVKGKAWQGERQIAKKTIDRKCLTAKLLVTNVARRTGSIFRLACCALLPTSSPRIIHLASRFRFSLFLYSCHHHQHHPLSHPGILPTLALVAGKSLGLPFIPSLELSPRPQPPFGLARCMLP